MVRRWRWLGVAVLVLAASTAWAQAGTRIVADLDPNSATGIRIEGLAADKQSYLYTVDLDSARLFRIIPSTAAVQVLGTLPRPGSGSAFDRDGNLYIASGDVVQRVPASSLTSDTLDPATVQTFATGVPGANGLAFDAAGNLYVSGGNTGTIYVVAPNGTARTFATGFTSEREEQRISTNGIAFGPDGKLYSANTGTGAIDRITVNHDGTAGQVERFVTDQRLLGADGITFAGNGDLFVAANERNAIVRVTPHGEVSDVASNGNTGPLEFPASLAFAGNTLYASNFDIGRGANAPNDPGVGASIAVVNLGIYGAPLPFPGPAPLPDTGAAGNVGPLELVAVLVLVTGVFVRRKRQLA